MLAHADLRVAVVGRNYKDVKDVCFEGDSGLCQIIDPENIRAYNRSDVVLTLSNGSIAFAYTSEKPDGMRGPQFNLFWADEFAAFAPRNAEDVMMQLTIATRRKGAVTKRGIITTTPRRVSHMKKIVEDAKTDPSIVIRRGKTGDNLANLPKGYMENMNRLYGNSRIGLQEIEGILLEDSPGALWSGDMIAAARALWPEQLPNFDLVYIGVDPSGGGDDATGVIAVGLHRGVIYVLGDYTTAGTPMERFSAVCRAAYEHGASRVCIESNFGADLNIVGFESAWKHLVGRGEVDGPMPKAVLSAVRGDKAKRAEPIVTLYEQGGRVAHAPGVLDQLETEQLEWDPTEKSSASPNSVDALTLAARALTDKPRNAKPAQVPTGPRDAMRKKSALTSRQIIR